MFVMLLVASQKRKEVGRVHEPCGGKCHQRSRSQEWEVDQAEREEREE